MTNYERDLKFIELSKEEIRTHELKTKDYTMNGDSLGNFKRVSQIMAMYNLDMGTPEGVCIGYMMKQLDCVLWQLSENYEGIEGTQDRLLDIGVYIKILRILLEERSENKA